ncbi:diphthine--ammonia ligase [Chloroflexota bacterium]
MKVISSWSGGKDSCIACYQAMQQGYQVKYLLNFVHQNGGRSMSHEIDSRLMGFQSQAADIPLLQREVTWESYEDVLKRVIKEVMKEGVTGCVFGDIDLQEHKDWIDRVCGEIGIEPILPLWGKKRETLMREFIKAGFEAIVICTKGKVMGQEWLGRVVNNEFIRDIKELQKTVDVDLCGEAGEYHTFVMAGPIFRGRIKVNLAQPVLKDEYWLSDILGYSIE